MFISRLAKKQEIIGFVGGSAGFKTIMGKSRKSEMRGCCCPPNFDVFEERIKVEWSRFSHHIHGAEDVAVVVTGLQVLGDVRKRAQVLWVLGRARDVTDFVFGDNVLRE